MRKYVREQVDRILDEELGRVYSVIVQMGDPEEELRSLLEASTEALHRRHLTTSARELVPPKAELIRKNVAFTPTERRKLRDAHETMTSEVALAEITGIGLEVLRGNALGSVDQLMTSEVVKQAMRSASRRSRKKAPPGEQPEGYKTFWSSRSALLKLSRGELHRLPDSVPNISAVFPNRTVQLPPVTEVTQIPQEILDNKTSAWGVEKVGAMAVWGAYGTRGKHQRSGRSVKVAVLDTGVDVDHAELKGKVVDWAEFDGSGEQVPESIPHDSGKHGTHVCGTIAGGRPESPSAEFPWIGVVPDATLAVGLVLKGGSGTYAQILGGMDWAIEAGAEVINMSLGAVSLEPDVLDVYTRSIVDANRLGIPVVVSIGNAGAQTSGAPGNDYFAFAVGATDYNERPAGFSGGRTQIIRESRYIQDKYLPLVYSKPDVSAPGVAVRSCVPNDRYATWNGTSMAAPHVSGAVALLLAATDIHSVPAQRRAYLLQDLITSSVEELGESGRDHRFGFGRINILRAIAFAREQGY